MARGSGSTGGGGSKFFDKRFIIVVLSGFALLVGVPAGLNAIAALILFIAVIFVVYHNGVQVSDFLVALVLGVVLADSWVGDASHWLLDTGSDLASNLPIAR